MKRRSLFHAIILSLIIIGIGTSLYAFITYQQIDEPITLEASKVEPAITEHSNDLEPEQQLISGIIVHLFEKELIIRDGDGRLYQLYIMSYNNNEIENFGLAEGMKITVKGEIITHDDVRTFEYFQLQLPEEMTKEDIEKVELLYNEAIELEKNENYEQSELKWQTMFKIIDKYYIAKWQPEPFATYILYYDNITFTSEELMMLEQYYNDWVALRKEGRIEEADGQMAKFYEIVDKEFNKRPNFAIYIEDFPVTINDEDLQLLEPIYKLALSYEELNNWEKSGEQWQQFYQILDPYFRANYNPPSFEEYVSTLELNISDMDLLELQPIYEEAVHHEKLGDWAMAQEKWNIIYKLLEPYYDELMPTLFKVSQIIKVES